MNELITKTLIITPEMALDMLEKNKMNRNIDKKRVQKYAAAMKSGAWEMNGSTIVFAEDGTLLDGQHRLWAVIDAETPIEFLVVYNAPKSSITTLDIGKTRTARHILQIEHSEHSTTAAMLAKLLWIHDFCDCNLSPENCRKNVSLTILRQFYDERKEMIEQAADLAEHGSHHFVKSYMALAYCLIGIKTEHKEKIYSFFETLKTGASIGEKHPLMTLRTKLLDNRINHRKLSVQETIAGYIRAWNAYVRGKDISVIRWNSSESIPEVL